MKILPKPISFEWDKGNSDKNLIKHGVSNQETEEVFISQLKYLFIDEKHSGTEKRFMLWGVSKNGRKLTVFFTIRHNKIRIISARDMHRKERRVYEEKIKAHTKI